MKLKSISLENYKAFLNKQVLELRPITFLIGKNSSGKSSIAKLLTLLENSLSLSVDEPILLRNNDVEIGGEFMDIIFGKQPSVPVKFSVQFEEGYSITVSILQEIGKYDLTIFEWIYQRENFNFHITYTPEGYINEKGEKYICRFKGIIPVELLDEKGRSLMDSLQLDTKIDVDYIGPFRMLPERQFCLTGQINYNNTGSKGENAYLMLGVSKLAKHSLHEKVGEWYKEHFNEWELKVDDRNKPFIQILLSKNESEINIVDVGQGMNQVLPLIVRANVGRENSIIVTEQPELHLHPAAHGDVAELFARSAKLNNQTFVIETHSENFLLRIRKLIIENDFNLTKDDVIIYWIDDAEVKGQEINKITITADGTLSTWPEGIFNENLLEIVEMRKALGRKKTTRST